MHSYAELGFGKAGRKHSQGRTEEEKPGKMLQKLLPWQLQEELLWQRKLQVQKDQWQHLFPQ